jgi:hypothetical protein
MMRTLGSISDRQSVAQRLAALSASDRRLWGRMTAHQVVCHLCDSYKCALGEKSVSEASGFAQRTMIKFIALQLPLRWPKNTPTRPEVEQGVGGTAPTEFEKDRGELLLVLGRFCSRAIDLKIAHPFFGPLTSREWLRWGYLHADHHLRQFGR